MKLRTVLLTGCICAAMAAFSQPAAAANPHACEAAQPTAASSTWDFQGETNTLFNVVEADARQAAVHADRLQSYGPDQQVSWEFHAEELEYVREAINDLGTKLCRLEAIKNAAAPWQQHTIDGIAANLVLMANSAEDAIRFGKARPQALWMPTYQQYLRNIYNDAHKLAHSVANAVEFASVSKEYQVLRQDVGAPTNP